MPDARFVTFRDQTTGGINDLLLDEGQPCAQSQNLLGYLAGALLSYTEEGIDFAPSIVLCNSINGLLTAFPGAVSHTIGKVPLDYSSGPQILKDCASLCGCNWHIFIERASQGQVHYGVFSYFRLPTAISLAEGVSINANEFCILIRKVSLNTIELRGAKGGILTLIFSTTRESANTSAPINSFAYSCCKKIYMDNFRAYFGRLLEAVLASCHGTILTCGENLDLATMPEMQDAVAVSPALDFQTAFAEYQTANSAGSILTLQRCEELLQGFLRCDGIVMFDTSANVTAYRVFFRPNAAVMKIPTIVGGARRRAYEGIKELVGSQLVSVLFRSQDGLMLYHGDE